MARPTRLRFLKNAPSKAPQRVLRVLSDAAAGIQLDIIVSDRSSIKAYGFSYAGVPVPMSQGKGSFFAVAGKKGLLEWVMVGDAGGTMKVVVKRGTETIRERATSTIPGPEPKAYDAFEILVN